jgi:conjugal transfer mating pair stabilization protein TraG
MTVNVITSGGGQYIVNVLNAVAAWTGGGGFRSMLQVVMVMGLGYSLLVMAFSLNWRVLFHWFLSATAMYMCMIVPTTTVVVSDTINPTVGNGAVANVPIGLAMVASFSSQVNNWLTKTAESVFTMPSALTYSAGGMIYPTRLNDLTSQFTIADPIMKANVEGYLAQCTFYDILLGQGMAGRRSRVPICSPPLGQVHQRVRPHGSLRAAAPPRSSAARAPIRPSFRPFLP